MSKRKGQLSRATKVALSSEERAVESIIARSQCYGEGQSVKPLIDTYILSGFADSDEMDHERSLERRPPNFVRQDELPDAECHQCECDCAGECCCEEGRVVLKNCTGYDLMGIPEALRIFVTKVHSRLIVIRDKLVEVFDLVFSFEAAEQMGFVR